jgi:hypothetical protein
MGTKVWKGLIILAGAALLVLTTGTAVVAMINDDDGGVRVVADDRRTNPQGGAVAAICARDVPDCQDTIVDGGASFEQCATEEPCVDFDAKCAADSPCFERRVLEALSCEPGQSIEVCYPDGPPTGYDCVTQESFPVQVVCFPVDCVPYDDGGVTILPAPTPYDKPIEEPQSGIDVGEPNPSTITTVCTSPHVLCDGADPSAVHCPPIIDPCSPDPDPTVRCLPSDCAISSDGAIDCPLPQPCVPIDDTGVTAPEPGCEQAAPPAGGRSNEGSPGAEATVIGVEPQ